MTYSVESHCEWLTAKLTVFRAANSGSPERIELNTGHIHNSVISDDSLLFVLSPRPIHILWNQSSHISKAVPKTIFFISFSLKAELLQDSFFLSFPEWYAWYLLVCMNSFIVCFLLCFVLVERPCLFLFLALHHELSVFSSFFSSSNSKCLITRVTVLHAYQFFLILLHLSKFNPNPQTYVFLIR